MDTEEETPWNICTCTGNECCSACPVEETPEPYDGYMFGDD